MDAPEKAGINVVDDGEMAGAKVGAIAAELATLNITSGVLI